MLNLHNSCHTYTVNRHERIVLMRVAFWHPRVCKVL
jgi:hypothetical protein